MTTDAARSQRSAITDKTWMPLSLGISLVAGALVVYSCISDIRRDAAVEKNRNDNQDQNILEVKGSLKDINLKLDYLVQQRQP